MDNLLCFQLLNFTSIETMLLDRYHKIGQICFIPGGLLVLEQELLFKIYQTCLVKKEKAHCL